MDDFCYKWKPSCAYHKSTLFVVSKNECLSTDKSKKNALYVQQYGKRYLSGWSDVEQQKKIKPIASGYMSLKASGRQADRQ